MNAPFIQFAWGTPETYPIVRGTRGRFCQVYLSSVRARPDPYPRRALSKKEAYLFHRAQSFTPLVDHVLQIENDVTLSCEVLRLCRVQAKLKKAGEALAEARIKYNNIQWRIQESHHKLARANTYQRLKPRLFFDLPNDTRLELRDVEQHLATIDNPWLDEPPANVDEECDWCGVRDHGVEGCVEISRCALCAELGHRVEQCPTPHAFCTPDQPCQAPYLHANFATECEASIMTF